MIGGLLVGFLSQKLFMASIIKKIYHIRKYENIEHEAQRKLTLIKSGRSLDEEVSGRGGPLPGNNTIKI
jgi:hypothetical protein